MQQPSGKISATIIFLPENKMICHVSTFRATAFGIISKSYRDKRRR